MSVSAQVPRRISSVPVSASQRQALVLQAWEAVSTQRELQGVMEAITNVLMPYVPFASVAIIAYEGKRHDLYALHVVGFPQRKGETLQEFCSRPELSLVADPHSCPLKPYEKELYARALAGEVIVVEDILAQEAWYEHEFYLARAGIRGYTSIPLPVQGHLIGSAVFTRREPIGFLPEEVALLSDASRALAIAAANALANGEISRLRDQLAAENMALREQLGQTPWFDDIVGESAALRRVLESAEQVAGTDATVMITGETGTGKELIARAIHRRSSRARGPMIKVNCGAIPETLLASELFGHERGAFTGALERRKGRFEQADGGTLFLDEVGEIPLETQVMLLRVLQEREFERLGGNQTVRVDVRIVTATNRDLAEQVRNGEFRSDLYYRLNVFPVNMPPLRERPDDIPSLVTHFAAKHGQRFGRAITRVDGKSLSLLRSYHWPGNVRELENVVERAVILSRNGNLRVERDALPCEPAGTSITAELKSQERETIEAALRASRGRIAGPDGAAKRLGLPASSLEFRIKRLGIDKFKHRGERQPR